MVREEFQAGQWQFPFVVYRPEVMSDNLPMIVQLHGAGERGTGYDQLSMMDIHGFSNMLKNGEECQCIFVMPQCRPESFWVAEIPNIIQGSFDLFFIRGDILSGNSCKKQY